MTTSSTVVTPVQRCRFYENKFPEVDELVVVKVLSIEEMGAYVQLLEYNNVEGMILLSELSRRRIRSINKLIRVGRTECVMVLRVDKEKGYIDLSKRRASQEDVKKCEDRYNKGVQVHQILRQIAEKENETLENLYIKLGWPLARKYGHAFEGLKKALQNPSILDEFDISETLRNNLMKLLQRRLATPPKKIRADVEVTCYQYEGINAIQAALRAGLAHSTEAMPVKITLIASPLYVITTVSQEEEAPGIELLNKVMESIQNSIEESHGNFNVKEPPRCVTEQDDKQLVADMEAAARETRQVSGDDPVDHLTDDVDYEVTDTPSGDGKGGGASGGAATSKDEKAAEA